ncbi:NADH dehydrogenase I subunit L [Striga asiatica]|uniref:NADH dehydrogenase I subunit L n=1 Tax=Striga asiatica TaxID=4170 RepID=A0A5A7Q0L0_STRAF|nr:NADH dehydrogenase I subunit L [Striga asiatica]
MSFSQISQSLFFSSSSSSPLLELVISFKGCRSNFWLTVSGRRAQCGWMEKLRQLLHAAFTRQAHKIFVELADFPPPLKNMGLPVGTVLSGPIAFVLANHTLEYIKGLRGYLWSKRTVAAVVGQKSSGKIGTTAVQKEIFACIIIIICATVKWIGWKNNLSAGIANTNNVIVSVIMIDQGMLVYSDSLWRKQFAYICMRSKC